MKILQCTQNDAVVNFNDVIRIAYCVLNIKSTQPVANLSFEWTLYTVVILLPQFGVRHPLRWYSKSTFK